MCIDVVYWYPDVDVLRGVGFTAKKFYSLVCTICVCVIYETYVQRTHILIIHVY